MPATPDAHIGYPKTRRKVRVLVVDDSALIRDLLARGLSLDPLIEVVGTAPDVYVARDKIVELKPDVLTLDIEMPRMDGVEFLRRLMPQYPIPVVVVSSLTQRGKQITLDALEAGAVDFVPKPSTNVAQGVQAMMAELVTKVKIASTANVSHWKHQRGEHTESAPVLRPLPRSPFAAPPSTTLTSTPALAESTDKIIVIGASTGGTEAIRRVLAGFPRTIPGIVVVQHMPAGFTRSFAERLNHECDLVVKEAQSGDRVMRGHVLVAPGGLQTTIIRSGGRYETVCRDAAKVNGHSPSVDVTMLSVAQHAARNAFGVILTGMGADGAQGMKALRSLGAETFGQNEQSCVVYGMPKVAFELGGVEHVHALDDISQQIVLAARRVWNER
jgi:two-component system, chemotaxis family, protein-glutamate methylesterase/glutaminase